jgi:hypothetical protein
MVIDYDRLEELGYYRAKSGQLVRCSDEADKLVAQSKCDSIGKRLEDKRREQEQ